MRIHIYWAKSIPVRWFKLAALACLLSAVVGTAPAKSKAKTGAKKAPAKSAAKSAKAQPAPSDLPGMVRAYREAPTAARRAAILSYAVAHPREAALANLGLGVAAWEQKDFAGAVNSLAPLGPKLPQIADYIAYHLNAARVELRDLDTAARDLAVVRSVTAPSPFEGRTRVLQARALTPARATEAIRVLTDGFPALPQPEGDLALAEAYRAVNDLARAAGLYQRVYYQYPGGDAAAKADAALDELRAALGAAYPAPSPEQVLRRGDRFLELRDYERAKTEFLQAAARLSGVDRDRARVRAGAADLLSGQARLALPYLRGLEIDESEADAERLYYVVESARRTSNEGALIDALEQLARRYGKSEWRERALMPAAGRFLLNNRPDQYVPLYRALYENFPADPQAAFAHWKVAFAAHMSGQGDAGDLLREQLRLYPAHSSASAALYFLGRRADAEGDAGAARACYTRLTEVYPNQFYAVLARERLAEPRIRAATPAAPFLAAVAFPQRTPPEMSQTPLTAARVERSRLLRQAGLGDFADSELRFAARNDGQPVLAAMEMAGAAESSFLALRAMKGYGGDYLNLPLDAAPRQYWEYLFPLPWRTEMESNAEAKQLDPYVLAGLIRQESEFNPKAVSRAKAYGLTQIRPPTGRMFARQEGVARVSTVSLMQPATNLKLGAAILRSMLDHQGGQWERTLAAYNAGPGRVADWITWGSFREPAEFIESIPFTETREYVQAVLRNADVYRRLYHGRARDQRYTARAQP